MQSRAELFLRLPECFILLVFTFSLEANHLVSRNVYDTFPPTIEYEVTEHAGSLYEVMKALRDWGQNHRKK